MFDIDIPAVLFVTSHMSSYPLVLKIDLQLLAMHAYLYKFSHRMIRHRVAVGPIADGGIFVYPALLLFTANHPHCGMMNQSCFFFRKQLLCTLPRSLLSGAVQSL